MNIETIKKLGKPNEDIEYRILEYISGFDDKELEQRICDKNLTLEKCWDFCYNNGRKLAKKNRARISDEQELKWIREYFGVKEENAPASVLASVPDSDEKDGAIPLLNFDDIF